MQRVSKRFYLWYTAISVPLGLLAIGAGLVPRQRNLGFGTFGQPIMITETNKGLTNFGIFLLLLVGLVLIVLFSKMWSAIQDGQTRTSTRRAVLPLLIPLFNLYWIFRAVWGFSREYNRFIERHALNVSRLPEPLFLTFCVLFAVLWLPIPVPHMRLILLGAIYIVGLLVVARICQAVNRLPAPQHVP